MLGTKTINSVAPLVDRQIVSARSKLLFSFATKHRLKNPKGKLLEDGMILTHLTDFAPNRGYIDSARSGAGFVCDSVHFAVNHGVKSHLEGNWNSKKYAILMPMNIARQTAGNNFVGGVAADFYSKGRVKIPKGSVLVRYNEKVLKGQYQILDASKIEEFKDLHGVKLIETSSTDMSAVVDNIVSRLGYRTKSGSAYTWGGSMYDFNSFNSYLRRNEMKPMFHSYTPNAKIEQLIENIKGRATNSAEWVVKDNTGNVIIDYQQECLQSLKYIEEFTKRTGFPNDFDTSQIAQIIRTSKTPQEALDLIESRLNIKPLEFLQDNISELDLFTHYRKHVGGNDIEKNNDSVVLNYLKKANKKTSEEFESFPSTSECMPDSDLRKSGLRNTIISCLKKYHINFDNSVANKLYELG